jgi:5'-3' exonuclease
MIGLIDGDGLAFFACKPRGSNQAVLYSSNFEVIQEEFTDKENADYLRQSWELLLRDIKRLREALYLDATLIAVKGSNNFRNVIFPEYKLNRKSDPMKHNTFVPTLRELLVHEGLAVASHGREADDVVRMWAEQCTAAGEEFIVISGDKDLDCIPGMHYDSSFLKNNEKLAKWRLDRGPIYHIEPLQASRLFYAQLLQGDPVDNIPGIPGIGPKRAEKLVESCASEEDMQTVVVEQYAKAFGHLWFTELLFNGKLLYLQKHQDDYFCCSSWEASKIMFEVIPGSRTAGAVVTRTADFDHHALSGGNTDVKPCGIILEDTGVQLNLTKEEVAAVLAPKVPEPVPDLKKERTKPPAFKLKANVDK